jgi:DNA repair photolyase
VDIIAKTSVMALVTLFDPWKARLCTCPKKYTFNPYTGCSNGCLYCYITSYIPRGHETRAKKSLLKRLSLEKEKLDRKILISISNSSDPYPPLERELMQTRACLRLLKDYKIQIVTKSDLVTRDMDILGDMRSSVAITITTLDPEIAKKLEPGAPSPEKRVRALQKMVDAGIPVSCRVDPVIPFLNEDFSQLIKELGNVGVPHVTSSTFKPRHDSWRRITDAFPDKARKLKEMYYVGGESVQSSRYLSKEVRMSLMKKIRIECDQQGITFGACREGFKLNTARSCDGTHLI